MSPIEIPGQPSPTQQFESLPPRQQILVLLAQVQQLDQQFAAMSRVQDVLLHTAAGAVRLDAIKLCVVNGCPGQSPCGQHLQVAENALVESAVVVSQQAKAAIQKHRHGPASQVQMRRELESLAIRIMNRIATA